MNIEQLLKKVDTITEPPKMTKGEALEFLEQLNTEIEQRIECIRDEMTAAGQDWG